MGGIKLRASYSTQVKVCGHCGDNHLRHQCPQPGAEDTRRDIRTPKYEHGTVTSVFPVNVQSRKRLLSNGVEDNDKSDNENEELVPEPPHADDEPNLTVSMDSTPSDADKTSPQPSFHPNLNDLLTPDVSFFADEDTELDKSIISQAQKFKYDQASPDLPTEVVPSSVLQKPEGAAYEASSPTLTSVSTSFKERASAMVTSLISTRVHPSEKKESTTQPLTTTTINQKKRYMVNPYCQNDHQGSPLRGTKKSSLRV